MAPLATKATEIAGVVSVNHPYGDSDLEAKSLLQQGHIVLKGVVSAADCDVLLSHVLAASDEGKRLGRRDLFGNIQENEHRHDLKLDLCVPVVTAANQVMLRCAPVWKCVMGDNVRVVELAAITSDPGAVAQPVHADTMHGITRFLQSDVQLPETDAAAEQDDDAEEDLTSVVRAIGTDTALIYTCLVALQDIEPDMGPTHVWPATNTVEHHATLWNTHVGGKLSVAEADNAFGVAGQRMTLRKGDLVLYDSRTMHCGGANISDKRRSVFVLSTMGPGIRPDGTTWTLLPSLRNRLHMGDFPLSLESARSPVADPSSGEILLPPLPETQESAKADSHKPVPPLEDWDAAVQCTLCKRWRPCSAEEAPKITGTEHGFACPMLGFSCLQEQVYTSEQIDAFLSI
jgi:ectoine hydroxylase-related dioxygenase (phytanoyl-CoA dioxygenase family)